MLIPFSNYGSLVEPPFSLGAYNSTAIPPDS